MMLINQPLVTSYHISTLKNDHEGDGSYFNIAGIEGKMWPKDNKWHFYLDFYLVLNAEIPVDLLYTNIDCELFRIENIAINHRNNQQKPSWLQDPEETQIYLADFIVDMTQSEIDQQQLINYPVNLKFSFGVDYDVLNQSNFSSSNNDINVFLMDVNNCFNDITFRFSNCTNSALDSGMAAIPMQANLSSREQNSWTTSTLRYDSNNYDLLDCPINNLATIQPIDSEIRLDSIKVSFQYWNHIANKTSETIFESNINMLIASGSSYNIEFNQYTSFDLTSYEIAIDNSRHRIKGFYIPYSTYGQYQLIAKLSTPKISFNLILTNPFVFVNNDIATYYCYVSDDEINDISNFKQFIWNQPSN